MRVTYLLWADSRKQRNSTLGLDRPRTWEAGWSDAQSLFQSPTPHTTQKARPENNSTEPCYTFLRASGPMSNCVAFSWAFWKQNCSAFYTYRERKWGKQQRVSGLKRNRRSPLPNSPHPQVPLSMKNGAKLHICKSLRKNDWAACPAVTTKCLCISFQGRVCGSPSSSCSPGGTGHWDPLLVMP